ncbi:MAG: hypothetical protein ACI8UQ_001470 [Bacteroidia bacterium]|jgi:hypothetical protein
MLLKRGFPTFVLVTLACSAFASKTIKDRYEQSVVWNSLLHDYPQALKY